MHAPIAPTEECVRLVTELGEEVRYIILPTTAVRRMHLLGRTPHVWCVGSPRNARSTISSKFQDVFEISADASTPEPQNSAFEHENFSLLIPDSNITFFGHTDVRTANDIILSPDHDGIIIDRYAITW